MARVVKSTKPLVPKDRKMAASLLKEFVAIALKYGAYALDTETTGLSWFKDTMVMVSLYTPGMNIVIPTGWENSTIGIDQLKDLLAPLTLNKQLTCYFWNAKFDMHFCKMVGIIFKNTVADGVILAQLCNNTLPKQLKERARLELKMGMVDFNKLFKITKRTPLTSYDMLDVAEYAGRDAEATYKLCTKLTNGGIPHNPKFTIGGREENVSIWKSIELKLTRILFKMECRGIYVNQEAIAEWTQKVDPQIAQLEGSIIAQAGMSFNPASVQQLSAVFARRGLHLESTDEKHLLAAKEQYDDPLIPLILEYRGLKKLKSTYAVAMLDHMDHNGKVHTSFNQCGTNTGRLSSSDPNMQNIPRESEIRNFFKPKKGYVFVVRDEGQLELRVVAHAANDPVMIQEFKDEKDIHRMGAAAIFNKRPEDITDDERTKGKSTSSFGVLFGMGPKNLAAGLPGVTEEQAEGFINRWFGKYRRVDQFFKRVKQSGSQTGYVDSFFGRRRYIPDLRSKERWKFSAACREGCNCVVQGPAADLVKLAMICADANKRLKEIGAEMLLQVHDELLFQVPEEHAWEANCIIDYCMTKFPVALKLKVPLTTEGGIGYDWSSAKGGDKGGKLNKLNQEFKDAYEAKNGVYRIPEVAS